MEKGSMTYDQAVHRLTEAHQHRAKQQVDAQMVYDRVLEQLNAANRFRPEINQVYAALTREFYTTQAERFGLSPVELFERYPMSIGAERIDGAQYDQAGRLVTDGEAFRKWFDGSKVVDATGKPLVVYHGTGGDFAVFEPERAGQNFGGKDSGVYFTNNAGDRYAADSSASSYAKYAAPTGGANVMPVYLVMKNPLVIADEMEGGPVHYADTQREDIRRQVEAGNHDGVILRDMGSELESLNDGPEELYIALHPEQIKSAVGNRGTFDPCDVNILNQSGEHADLQGVTVVRGSFNPATLSIALFKSADLSTFLHESGHFYLELLASMAAHADAPAGIKADFDVLLKFFGVRDASDWNRMSHEQRRKAHEQFARSFEAYLMEGKAPSVELQSLFVRFRSWLLNIYRQLSNLNVELTPDVRGVMDRLIASDETIRHAERGHDYPNGSQRQDIQMDEAFDMDAEEEFASRPRM